jgi:hypothetical protein
MASGYKTKREEEVEEAREELASLFKQREELEVRIAKQQRRVAALATLVDESEQSDQILELNLGGLTDVVRSALRAGGPRGLTPMEMRTRLSQLSFPTNEYKNFMASLHSVIKRLVDAGEVRTIIFDKHEGRDGSVYQWVGGIKNKSEGRFKNRFESRLKPPKGRFEKD